MIVHNFQGRSIDKLEHYLRLKEKTISFPRFDSDYRLQVPGKLSIIISSFLFDININCLHESVIVLRKRNSQHAEAVASISFSDCVHSVCVHFVCHEKC